MDFKLAILSCKRRTISLQKTLQSLRQTDWQGEPFVQVDPFCLPDPKESQTVNAKRLLENVRQFSFDYLLFCEDDVLFNKHIRHNLQTWNKVTSYSLIVGSLYFGSGAPEEVDSYQIGGSQGVLIRRDWIDCILEQWDFYETEMQDLRIYRSLNGLIPIHQPNLVQHRPEPSTWDGPLHISESFSPDWKR